MPAAVLDINSLLMPIPGTMATGKDLRTENFTGSLYHQIKDARLAARTLERQQIQGSHLIKPPDWHSVQQLTVQALTVHTKDLEITAWLIEASLRIQGFAGLEAGFNLAKELIIKYWEDIYPQPDEDGLITRLAPLAGLNGDDTEGTLIAPIALIPLTQGQTAGPFALWQYQQALAMLKITEPEKRKQRLAAGAVTLEQIAQAAAETSADFFQIQRKRLQSCIESFNALNQIIEAKAGLEAPPSSRILAQLQACIECINNITENTEQSCIKPSPEKPEQAENKLSSFLNASIRLDSNIKTQREQLLQNLLTTAEFFRTTEPHSPVPYLLERAVRWSTMPLPHLIKELIKDEQVLSNLGNLTGLNL